MPNQIHIDYVREPHMRRHAEAIFFLAMKQRYATKQEKGNIPQIPGSKTIEFTADNGWRVLDTWVVTPHSPYSGGTTIIYNGEIPMWMMQYVGWYDDCAISCLKAALKENYDKGCFLGGRGPEFFKYGDFHYTNTVVLNTFHGHAVGEEKIFGANNRRLGFHRYQAQWLIPD